MGYRHHLGDTPNCRIKLSLTDLTFEEESYLRDKRANHISNQLQLKHQTAMKTFRLIGTTFLAVIMCVYFASCSSDDKEGSTPPSGSAIEDFNQTAMNFTEKAGEQFFSFTANSDWAVNVAATSGGNTWCTATPTQGEAGSQTVKITTTENDTYDDRSVTITLTAGNDSKSFVVTQKQKNAILLTSDKYEIDPKGGTFTVEVKANVNYTATIGETCKEWITEESNTRALSTTNQTYSVTANESGEKREGTITFTDGTLSETVHIYQAGGDIILLSKNEYNVDAAGEDITVELRSNCEYEVEMPKVDWIHTVSTRAMSSHTLHYTIDANTTYDSREAKIIYRNKKNDVTETLTIVQAQKDAIILGQKEVTVGADGETIEVKLSANVDYEVKMPDVDWIAATTTRGLTEHTLYYDIAKNESDDSRTAKIVFTNKDSGLEEVLTVTQKGNREIVTIDVPVAGELPNITERTDFKALKLTGRLNGQDVKMIRRMRHLEYLDISEVNIIGGEKYHVENKVGGGYVLLENNTIGMLMFNNDRDMSSPLFENLKEVLLPNSVTRIERYAFDRVHSLCKVELPDKLETIGESAFNECNNITDITIPNGVTAIESGAFSGCNNLYSITIPNSVTSIGGGIFSYCEKLTNISLPSNLTQIKGFTFSNCSSLKDIKIPEGITMIGNSAFQDCKSLEKVSMPTSVTEIGDWAFRDCESLTGITIPNGVKTIGELAFWGCSILNVTIPQSVTEIGSGAFNKLNEVRIFCTTPPTGYIKCDKLYIPKGTYQKYFLTNWGANATDIIEMEE